MTDESDILLHQTVRFSSSEGIIELFRRTENCKFNANKRSACISIVQYSPFISWFLTKFTTNSIYISIVIMLFVYSNRVASNRTGFINQFEICVHSVVQNIISKHARMDSIQNNLNIFSFVRQVIFSFVLFFSFLFRTNN